MVTEIVLDDKSIDSIIKKMKEFIEYPTVCSSMSETFCFIVKKNSITKSESGITIINKKYGNILIPFKSIFGFFSNSIEIVFGENYIHLFNF